MSGAERAGWRLAHRLAWRLAAVMLTAITLASVAVAWRSVATIRSLDDATLQSQARLVAGQLSAGPDGRPVLSMPAQLAAAFGADDGQSLFIVYDGRDQPTATSDPRASTVIAPFLPERPQRGFFKVPPSSVYEQGLVGVVIPAGPWRVVVAQAHEQNDALIESLIREFALSAAWLLLPIAAVTVGVGVLTIRHGLRTLREVSSAASLVGPHRPGVRLPVANLPGEIVPLVHAMNEALERLERALETQRRFFGSAAHALRTPLAVLTARIDALPDSEAKRALRADTDRTTRLVGQLLSLARLEELPLDVSESVDLPDAAAEVIADLAPLAIGKGVELALTAGNQTRPIRGNRAAIILALSNLIDNAITYAPPGSVIDIVITAPATIAVQDRGPGVAEGERSAIFARFHRARGARSGGSGLGLTIVAEIAAAHGGSVRLEQPEGGGATFVLHLGDRT